MPSTFFGLDIALSGMYASQVGINTTAHNMNNERTVGYSRQVVDQTARQAFRVYAGYGMVGAGTLVTDIRQMRDSYYDIKFWTNNTKYGEQKIKNFYMDQIEGYFNEMIYPGFTEEYDKFFNAIDSLSNNPSDLTYRSAVLNAGQSLCDFFNNVKSNYINLQEDLNSEISSKVSEINTITAQIASLNRQINTVEINGGRANDLRDKRALLLDQLSMIVPIDVKEEFTKNGRTYFSVKVQGYTLVDDNESNQLKVVSRDVQQNPTDAVGLYDIQFGDGWTFDVQSMAIHGELKALFELRDGNNNMIGMLNEDDDYDYDDDDVRRVPIDYKGVPYYMKRINGFIEMITQTFNEIHYKGEDLKGNPTEEVDFFVTLPNGNWGVNPVLLRSPELMATTGNILQGVGKSDLVEEMKALREMPLFANGTADSKRYMQSIIAEISMAKQKAEMLEKNYGNIEYSITKQRLSVSGVDGDEEAMNMVLYQELFNLSAKMMQVMQEMLNKLINETGL